jgi:general stress protein CsbA
LIEDSLFSVTSVILCVLSLLTLKSKLEELNGWTTIMENHKEYCLEDGVSTERTEQIKRYGDVTAIYVVVTGTAVVLSRAVFSYDQYDQNYLRNLLLALAVIFQANLIFDMCQKMKMVAGLLGSMEDELKDLLKHPVYVINRGDVPLVDHLKGFKKLVMAVNRNLKLLMKSLLVVLISWEMQTIVCLIINIFIVAEFEEQEEYFSNVFMLQIRTVATTLGIVYLMFSAEDLRKRVSDTSR